MYKALFPMPSTTQSQSSKNPSLFESNNEQLQKGQPPFIATASTTTTSMAAHPLGFHSEALARILQHPKVWRASTLITHQPKVLPINTGHNRLNHVLNGGWPKGHLTELSYANPGIGELQLLLPALVRLSQESTGLIAWITPNTPHALTAPNPFALTSNGLALSSVLWIRPPHLSDALWAAEHCLGTGTCQAVLLWLPNLALQQMPTSVTTNTGSKRQPLPLLRHLQKLQLAAQRSSSWGVLMRSGHASVKSLSHSPAGLRFYLSNDEQNLLRLECLKRPGGWAIPPITLPLPGRLSTSAMQLSWPHSRGKQVRVKEDTEKNCSKLIQPTTMFQHAWPQHACHRHQQESVDKHF